MKWQRPDHIRKMDNLSFFGDKMSIVEKMIIFVKLKSCNMNALRSFAKVAGIISSVVLGLTLIMVIAKLQNWLIGSLLSDVIPVLWIVFFMMLLSQSPAKIPSVLGLVGGLFLLMNSFIWIFHVLLIRHGNYSGGAFFNIASIGTWVISVILMATSLIWLSKYFSKNRFLQVMAIIVAAMQVIDLIVRLSGLVGNAILTAEMVLVTSTVIVFFFVFSSKNTTLVD